MGTRFLFLFSDTGSGHRSGAQAVAAAMSELYPEQATVQLLDVLVASQKWPFHRFPAWYPHMIKARGVFWRLGYTLVDQRIVAHSLSQLTAPYMRSAFQRLLHTHPADVIVSFHPLANRLMALAKARWGYQGAVATVVLDFLSAPAFWFAKGLDLYVVPYKAMVPRAQHFGADPARVEALGMPVRPEVLTGLEVPKEEAKRRLGLPAERPVVLLLGGGDGVGPLGPIARQLLRQRAAATVAVITGRNQMLAQRLTILARQHPTLRVEGYVQRMDLWLRAADILVTKAGPNTLAEAFAMGLPIVLFGAIPGQEDGNVALVKQRGAGIWAPGARKSVAAIQTLLADPSLRQQMAARALQLATPHAAHAIARRLWQLGHEATRASSSEAKDTPVHKVPA